MNTITDYGFRENIGIAIDGGGIKGLIVAHGLIELERLLGVDRLLDAPQVKVIAGTSTGALLAFGIASGMSGQELVELYLTLGDDIFARPGPFRPFGMNVPLLSNISVSNGFIRLLEALPLNLSDFLLYPLFPARYSFDPLRKTLLRLIKERPPEYRPNTNPTLRDLGRHLEDNFNGMTVVITATEVSARKTHFLKTNAKERYQDMPVIDAVLASSCIPTYFPPVPLPTDDDPPRLLVDGGVGNFGNPAFTVAWELCNPANQDARRRYDPENTTVISFGTGVTSREVYRASNGDPRRWWALQWAPRSLDIFSDMSLREQSRTIVFSYPGIDLRRFQVGLERNIGADAFDLVDTILTEKGLEMRKLVEGNRHALNPDANLRNDPEGIYDAMLKGFLPGFR
jgi:uncharacterized protein